MMIMFYFVLLFIAIKIHFKKLFVECAINDIIDIAILPHVFFCDRRNPDVKALQFSI